jgi:LmbE family N-acetylglucosaminyl deacetylase
VPAFRFNSLNSLYSEIAAGDCDIFATRKLFPVHWQRIKDAVEAVKAKLDPSLIFTHFLEERHQDHRVLAELTWNSFRNHAILEYEIAKFEEVLPGPMFMCRSPRR